MPTNTPQPGPSVKPDKKMTTVTSSTFGIKTRANPNPAANAAKIAACTNRSIVM
jgi:hypothetical protein